MRKHSPKYFQKKIKAELRVLENDGYITIKWVDDVPYTGNIEQKAFSYFTRKDIYVRKMLREDSRFDLDDESEATLEKLNKYYISENRPYSMANNHFCSAQILKLLELKGLIEFSKRGISYQLNGDFVCMYAITQRGKNYFSDKRKFIDEIIAFPNVSVNQLIEKQFNIQSGDNSLVIGDNVGSISIDYFEQCQEAIEEIRKKLNIITDSQQKQEEIIADLEVAENLIKQKRKHPLKTIMKGVYDIIKDIGCSILSTLLISSLNL